VSVVAVVVPAVHHPPTQTWNVTKATSTDDDDDVMMMMMEEE